MGEILSLSLSLPSPLPPSLSLSHLGQFSLEVLYFPCLFSSELYWFPDSGLRQINDQHLQVESSLVVGAKLLPLPVDLQE